MVVDSHELALENVIKLIKSSEKNFKKGNFKDAIMEKLKAKSILKIAVPVAIMVQLTAIIFLLNRDKAFSCRAVQTMMVCRQVKI